MSTIGPLFFCFLDLPTDQRGGKMTKSAMAVPGLSEGQVSTVKILGSMWSKLKQEKKHSYDQSVRIVLKRHCHEICNHYFFRNLIYRHLIKYFFLGWASVLFKRTERSLSSFPFLIKEWNDLCFLFRSL